MRIHIELDDELVANVDRLSGPGGRSTLVRVAIEQAVAQQQRWAALESAAGAVADHRHEWDSNPSRWVREQRYADHRSAHGKAKDNPIPGATVDHATIAE
jgi:metal-responsive CopG/Arc/MetJ family transcriptional regulator